MYSIAIGTICNPPNIGHKDTEAGMTPVSFNRVTFNGTIQEISWLGQMWKRNILLGRKSVYLSKGYLYPTLTAERKKETYRVD